MKLYSPLRRACRHPALLLSLLWLFVPGRIFAAAHTVNIQGFAFSPSPVTVDAGDSVIWVQVDSSPHTSTSDASPALWNSGTLTAGKRFTNQFNTAGTFLYHCAIHPSMHGSVVVKQAQNQPPKVTLDGPGKGALFLMPASVVLSATATDADGSVTNVEFFDGTASLGRVAAAPFTLTINSFTEGTHTLLARATDNSGVSSDSSPVSLIVTTYNAYSPHALSSDLAGQAEEVDTNLVNPWGIAFSPTGPFWISDNHSGRSTVYDGMGMAQPLIVDIAAPGGGPALGAPTGIVFNSTTNFEVSSGLPAHFIFCTEDGTLCLWQTGTSAAVKVDNSSSDAIYKGLALAASATGPRLYVADFHNARVDVFDGTFQPVVRAGAFSDPTLPAGYAPFNIVPFRGNLLVSYALQDEEKEDDAAGEGHGFINLFDPDGNLLKRFASQGPLNSPWGMVESPDGFGEFSHALLVGNFGDGHINVFNPDTGEFIEALETPEGGELSVEGLWDLKFGNGQSAGDAARLYFTAGISGGTGELESHGLFGVISAVPAVEIQDAHRDGDTLVLVWAGGFPPFKVQRRDGLAGGTWTDAMTNLTTGTATLPLTGDAGFVRVVDAGGAVGAAPAGQMEVWCRAPR